MKSIKLARFQAEILSEMEGLHRKFMARNRIFIIITLFMLTNLGLAAPRFALVQGVLDLSAWNPDEVPTIDIIGEVEFAWGRYAMEEGWPESREFIPYPGAWNFFTKHPAKGFASYRLRVKLPQPMKVSLTMPLPWSASQIYVNGQLIHQEGQPGRREADTSSGMRGPFIWTWNETGTDVDIVMHVANYDLTLGGPLRSIRIGSPFEVQKARDREVATSLFLVGSIFIMAFYHFSVYVLRRRDYTALWFGLYCLTMTGFLLIGQAEGAISVIIPNDFRLRIQIFNLSWMASAVSFMWYCAFLFPHRFSRIYAWFISAVALGFVGLILATPVSIFAFYSLYFHPFMAIGMLTIGYAVYRAWREHQQSTRTFIFFACILFFGSIHDMLALRGLIDSINLVPACTFLFIFGQAHILAVRFSRAFNRAEESEAEVRQLNASLEAKVTEKTVNMQRMMDEMQGQRDKLQEVNTYISQHVLQRFLPPDLVADLVAGKQTFNDKPTMRDVTICFADLCSFTAATEWIGPQRVAGTLNEFLALMTQIIFEEGGTIDKFLGDGIMVIFGAPRELPPFEQAERSCRCALRMQEGLAQLNRKWKAEFNHEFQMRVGIHRGPALVGSFGSQLRSDFTAIGNTVNVASRVESQAKAGEILITSMVRDYLGSIAWEAAGSYKLKGLAGEMVLFRLLKEDKKRVA
jgi:class 3 adenylate cyclase